MAVTSQQDTPAQNTAGHWNGQTLFRLLWPLVVEQLLALTMGLADTAMVSGVGEAAVSGVSLVDSINMLLITAFTAVATGGAVVASQYIGRREAKNASLAAQQLVYVITAASIVIMGLALALRTVMLGFIYGRLEPEVLSHASTYLWLSAVSYPLIALYNAGAAIFRSMGNSKMSMGIALLVNLINIGGNALLIYGLNLGVAGAALSTLISRAVAGVVLIRLLLTAHAGPITLAGLFRFRISTPMIRQILRVGIPNGLENSMFHIGKLVLARMVASFGTATIAANAIVGLIATIANLPGSAFGMALLTVVGQCVGAGNYAAAKRNTFQLMRALMLGTAFLSLLVWLLHGPLLNAFALSPQAVALGRPCLAVFCIAAPFLWAPAFALPNALRAAGDARFTMAVSMFSMWTFRIGSAVALAFWLELGLLGVWCAMIADWVVRGLAFTLRYVRGKWQNKRLIG